MFFSKLILVVLISTTISVYALVDLNNGVGVTPAMGFMNWERYRCNIDCVNFPDECVSEDLFRTMADAMVSNGMRDAGYVYLSIDDCWMSKNRTAQGQLQPDPDRFPSGIKSLADYLHGKGLKLGIYEDFGTYTCAGYPGSQGYEEIDANTFGNWEVDMLKLDGCNSNTSAKAEGYIEIGKYLNQTGRAILYACSWPDYISNPNYSIIAQTCNMWRNAGDIQDSWNSVLGTINAYATNQDEYAKYQGPGQFNDPDQLIIGNNGLSYGQQKIHMSLWCLWSAPLFVSADLRNINQDSLNLLLNKALISIDQDPLGDFAKRVQNLNNGQVQIWVKRLGDSANGVNAICFFNARTDDQTTLLSYSLKDLGVKEPKNGDKFALIDVFTGLVYGKFPIEWDEVITVRVKAFDAVTVLVKQVVNQRQQLKPVYSKDKHVDV